MCKEDKHVLDEQLVSRRSMSSDVNYKYDWLKSLRLI